MPKTINVLTGKVLKLTNVLQSKININDFTDMQRQHEQMINYIKVNGFMPIGPIIQKSVFIVNEQAEPEISIYLLQQMNGFINNPQVPYTIEPIIRVPNCLYTRFSGKGENLKFAYDKINLIAYEQDLALSNENYTVFLEESEEDIVADIFVEQMNYE